jgi:hypothetical protein
MARSSTRSPEVIWCRNCDAFRPCRSINISSYDDIEKDYDEGELTGATSYGNENYSIKTFQRIRKCNECGDVFITSEVATSVLNELIRKSK